MIGYDHHTFLGFWWRSLPYGMALLSPPSNRVVLRERQLRTNFLSITKGILYVRWESEFDCKIQTPWWHVINDNPDSTYISAYSSKTRNQIKRGNKKYECRLIHRSFVEKHCYSVYKSATESYDTYESCLSSQEFIRSIRAMHPSTQFWGVFSIETGSLVGFAENYIEGTTCFYNSIWCDPLAVKEYCSYSLFYCMNQYYLLQKGFSSISDGARSISHSTNIHNFLISKFGFRRAYCRLNVCYHPLLAICIKCLFPFRMLFQLSAHPFAKRLTVLLEMEKIRRSCLVL